MSSILQWVAVDRKALQVGLLAACCVVAIALAAASLSSPVVVESDGGGDGSFTDDGDVGIGDEGDGIFSPGSDAPSDQDGFGLLPSALGGACYPIVTNPFVLLVLCCAYLGIGVIASRVFDFGVAVTLVVVLVMLTVLAMFVAVSGCPWAAPQPGEQLPTGENTPLPEEEGGGGDGAGTQPISTPTIVLVALLVLTLVGVLGALYLGRSEQHEEEADEPEPMAGAEDPARVGDVAGRTADALEDDASLENAVYRAWSDMTGALAVEDPETSTPGEFAEAATDAGMDPDDVAELTTLFEAVRYGDADVTDEREQRAIETLRRIESAYGEDER